MRTLALLLLLSASAVALTSKDEADIRTAIEEQAKIENQRGSDEIWSERLPLMYRIRAIEEVSADVAMAQADGTRGGPFSERSRYMFIMKRTDGIWRIVRKIRMYSGPPPGFQLIGELRIAGC